jgi:hypothetical protein
VVKYFKIDNCDVLLVLGTSLREEPSLVCVERALGLRQQARRGRMRRFGGSSAAYVAMVTLQRTMHDEVSFSTS